MKKTVLFISTSIFALGLNAQSKKTSSQIPTSINQVSSISATNDTLKPASLKTGGCGINTSNHS